MLSLKMYSAVVIIDSFDVYLIILHNSAKGVCKFETYAGSGGTIEVNNSTEVH